MSCRIAIAASRLATPSGSGDLRAVDNAVNNANNNNRPRLRVDDQAR